MSSHFKTSKNLRTLFFKIAPIKAKRNFILLVFLMTLGSLMELVSVGLIIPLLYAVSSPGDLISDSRISWIFDFLGSGGPDERIVKLILIFGAVFILTSIYRFLILAFNSRVSFGFGHYLSKRLLESFLSPNVRNVSSMQHSRFVSLVTAKSVNLTNGIIFPVFVVANAFTLSVFLTIFGLFISPLVFILIICFFGLIFVSFGYLLKPRLERNSEVISQLLPKQMKFSIDLFGSFREIIINQVSEFGVKKFGENDRRIKELSRKNLILSLMPRYFLEPLVVVLLVLLAIASASGVVDRASSIMYIGVIAFSLQRFLPIFQGAYTGWSNIQSESAILDEVVSALSFSRKKLLVSDSAYNGSPNLDLVIASAKDPGLIFKCSNLTFGFPGEEALFDDVNIEIKRGDRIAIAGESGSGKSTLADIIMGIIHPRAGKLFYAGYGADSASPFSAYWKHLTYMPQDIRFVNDTLANNINFLSDQNPDESELLRAIEIAKLDKVICNLDKGLDQQIHDDGSNFSGGERQRIGLARAVFKQQINLIIFDEPTSSLDRETSDYIIGRIKSLGPDVAVVVITHDETILGEFSKIYKFNCGKVELVKGKRLGDD